jgi:hypothetical protein
METVDMPQKKKILSFVGKGMGPERFNFFLMVLEFDLRALCLQMKNIIISEVRFRKPKSTCFLSYVE